MQSRKKATNKELTPRHFKQRNLACVNLNLRKASRAVTRYYDDRMRTLGITSTQFSLIGHLLHNPQQSIQTLADQLLTDRSTLSRNLKLLNQRSLVKYTQGKDKRTRIAAVTAKGKQIYANAVPVWEGAQSEMLQILGDDGFKNLRRVTAAVSRQG